MVCACQRYSCTCLSREANRSTPSFSRSEVVSNESRSVWSTHELQLERRRYTISPRPLIASPTYASVVVMYSSQLRCRVWARD